MLEPSMDGRRLLRRWQPPTAFRVVVRYFGNRGPDVLWAMPFMVNAEGRVVLYLVAGPAGKPLARSRIVGMSSPGVPKGVAWQVVTETAPDGQEVYAQPAHTMN